MSQQQQTVENPAVDHYLKFGYVGEEYLESEDELTEVKRKVGRIRSFFLIRQSRGLTAAVNSYVEHVGMLPSDGFQDGSYKSLLTDPHLEEKAEMFIRERLGEM